MSKKQSDLDEQSAEDNPWWLGVTDKDIRYMSFADLFVTYIAFIFAFEAEAMYFQLGIMVLYLLDMRVFYMVVTGRTRVERFWSFMRQTTVAVAFISPLIAIFCSKWVW